jgi:hypothetical protein
VLKLPTLPKFTLRLPTTARLQGAYGKGQGRFGTLPQLPKLPKGLGPR